MTIGGMERNHQGRLKMNARLMIIGESPSHTRPEGQEHISFSGKTAHFLWEALQDAGLPIRGHLVTNIVEEPLPKGEKPTKAMAEENMPRLLALAEQFSPDVIVTVGKTATEAILGHKVKLKEVVGRLQHSEDFGGRYVFPIIHPAAAARSKKMKSQIKANARELAAVLQAVHFNEPRRYSVEIN